MAFYGSLGEVNFDNLDASITDTAVDVFVYDTRKDSDGGAWRKRTQNTSWYNETLGTATRGSRKEFPAVAVLVLEAGKLTIYDGDDPDLPMWMVFNNTGSNISIFGRSLSTRTSVEMLNGLLVISGSYSGAHFEAFTHINFISEKCQQTDNTGTVVFHKNISQRGETSTYSLDLSSFTIVNIVSVNDVAMTVLPNAPIDPSTGLPIPTIAVATNGGVSVIRDDGTVSALKRGSTSYTNSVQFTDNNSIMLVWGHASDAIRHINHYSYADWQTDQNDYDQATGYHELPQFGASTLQSPLKSTASGVVDGVLVNLNGQNRMSAKWDDYGLKLADLNDIDRANGMVAHIRPEYNSGWMHGDCKGAFLSDTDATNVTGTNLASQATQSVTARLTSETYTDGATSWQMVDNATNDNGYLAITFGGLTAGKSYLISLTVDGNAALDNGYQHKIERTGQSIIYINDWNGTGAATLTTTFEAVSGQNNLIFYANAITVNVSNFQVRELIEEDRSVNNKGLAVYGTITKTPVATGAELVAYSGFSNSNYLRQPHNTDLEIGTGEISISAWFKSSTSDTSNYKGLVYLNNPGSLGPGVQVMFGPGNGIYLYIYGASGSQNFGGNYQNGYNDGNWHQVLVSTKPGQQQIYLDGILKETGTVNTGSMTNTSSELYVGRWYGNANNSSYWWRGDIALVRVSRSIPSAEQVKKMYEDEKVLFQENAKATLYGSSDAVTALAYDEDTDLLHVGTSGGRSEFQGLRRINNTEDAVTTAISASNGLVAEQ